MDSYFEGCKGLAEVSVKYKTLAKLLHPDKGGTNESMRILNEHFFLIKKLLLMGSYKWIIFENLKILETCYLVKTTTRACLLTTTKRNIKIWVPKSLIKKVGNILIVPLWYYKKEIE